MNIKLPWDYEEIVDEVVNFTDLPRQEVEHRVWMQALSEGTVIQEAKHFGVTPHQYDDKMEQLYKEGYGLIIETMVFWASQERQLWIQQAIERIRLYAQKNARALDDLAILMLGDGTGNDSLELVKKRIGTRAEKAYHQVAYYISSLVSSATDFAQGIRGHWRIENSLHCLKHVIFHEDHSPIRMGNEE